MIENKRCRSLLVLDLCFATAALAAVATTPTASADDRATVRPNSSMAPEPDYLAVQTAEVQTAIARGTREALIRIVSRYSCQTIAQHALLLLKEGSNLPFARPGTTDPDTDVYVAFDVAFRADTTVAYDAFIERYAPHPLTDQALHLRDGR